MEPKVGQVFFGTVPCKDVSPMPRSSPREHKVAEAPPPAQGPISQLQELVQCSKRFPVAQNRSILSWYFDERTNGGGIQQFMATVSCYLHGVPHHLAGGWHSSKKLAQRDAAARALELLARQMDTGAQQSLQNACSAAAMATEDEVQQVESFCSSLVAGSGPGGDALVPTWSVTDVGGAYVAVLEVTVLGVSHSFCGAPQESREAARRDAARRTLWYLQHPVYLDEFQPPPANGAVPAQGGQANQGRVCEGHAEGNQARRAVDSPPVPWRKDLVQEPLIKRPSMADTENRLRRLLSLEPAPEEQIWQWTLKSLEGTSVAPARYRAVAYVPAVARAFTGPWRHSTHKAQKAVCALLEDFMDSWCREPPPREAPLPPDPGQPDPAAEDGAVAGALCPGASDS